MSLAWSPDDRNRPRLGASLALAGAALLCVASVAFIPTSRAPTFEASPHIHMATSSPTSAARPASVVRVLSCDPLPNVPGKSVTHAIVDYPPNAYTPAHRHPGSVSVVVVAGRVRTQLNDGPIGVFGPRETWFEPPGTLHAFAENPSLTEPATILATFVADADCGPLVIYEK